jgi:hypothetical protein
MRRLAVALFVHVLVLASTSTAGQTTDGGTVRGRITAADTGRPLRRARVSILTASETSAMAPIVATTNSLGDFVATNVPPGPYYVQAVRAGYLTAMYGQRRARDRGVVVEVKPRETVQRIDFKLPRPGVLAGVITDDLGEPYPGVRVEALDMRYRLGRRVPFPVALSTTDDLGQFRISGLQPGSYQLVASSSETWRTEKKESLGYASTYFPGVPGAEPQLITLGPSQARTDLHMTLQVGRTARLSGRVVQPGGRTQATQVTLAYSYPGLVVVGGMRSVKTAQDGVFVFDDVAGGVYNVGAGGGSEQIVTVAGADIDDIVLTPRTGSTVTGSVVTDEGTPPPFLASGVRVFLVAPDEKVLPTVRVPAIDGNWSFKLSNLGGNFLFRLRGLPDDWMIAAVRLEEKDLTDQPWDVPTGGKEIAGLKIVITQKIAKLSGEVVDGSGQPTPAATIVVFADDPELWLPGSRFTRTTRPDVDGRFSLTGLPAGTYRAIAREFVEDGQWEDRAFLKAARDNSSRVVLTSGEAQRITLKLPNPNER